MAKRKTEPPGRGAFKDEPVPQMEQLLNSYSFEFVTRAMRQG